jgi:Cys-rich repeat protein
MGRLFAVAVCLIAGGCYNARAFPGAPCTTDIDCPEGQTCIADRCELGPNEQPDAATTHSSDGAMTTPPLDAPGVAGPNGWYPATQVLGVNSTSMETDPSLTDDELTIVFTSDRAGGTGGLDLYLGTRASTSDPFTVRELSELNSTSNEQSPEIASDGLTIWFSTTRVGANALIYTATRTSTSVPFGAPAEDTGLSKDHTGTTQNNIQIGIGSSLIAIVIELKNSSDDAEGYERNTTSDAWVDEEDLSTMPGGTKLPSDFNAPSLVPDGSVVYYQSGSPAQIYMTTYDENADTFSAPVAITELNLGSRDATPEINAGGSHMVFERDGDIYEATK